MLSHTLRLADWLVGRLPAVLVLIALVGVAVWGASNDWRLPESLQPRPAEPDKKDEEPDDGTSPGAIKLEDDIAALAGVEVEPSRQETVPQEVEAPAVLAYDQARYAHLAARASGAAWRVYKSTGDEVRQGEVLALLSSPEAGKTRGEFLGAYVQHAIRADVLARATAASTALPERQVREARQALREARVKLLNEQQNLGNLGLFIRLSELRDLSDDQVAQRVRALGLPAALARQRDLPANLLPLTAPFDGVVVRRDLVIGEMTDPSKTSFVLADPRQLWLELDVRQEDAGRLALGQPVIFQARATGQTATGKLGWLSPEVDPRTRTVRVRADVYNPTGQLRPGTFGRARIEVRREPGAVTVPTAALQWDGRCYRVFVRRDEKFEPLLVLPGARQGKWTQLHDPRSAQYAGLAGWLAAPGGPWQALAGWRGGESILTPLGPGTRVATAGSFVLKSEMQKGRIGGED